jgi:hypothetical protein
MIIVYFHAMAKTIWLCQGYVPPVKLAKGAKGQERQGFQLLIDVI